MAPKFVVIFLQLRTRRLVNLLKNYIQNYPLRKQIYLL